MQIGENFNYVVPCDKDLNNETQNLFSLQNDDPRITKEEGIRTYSSIGICCQKLKELGLLSVAGTIANDQLVKLTALGWTLQTNP